MVATGGVHARLTNQHLVDCRVSILGVGFASLLVVPTADGHDGRSGNRDRDSVVQHMDVAQPASGAQ